MEIGHLGLQSDGLQSDGGGRRTAVGAQGLFSLGIVGAGQFSGRFATLFQAHPGVGDVYVTDLLPERAERLAAARGDERGDGVFDRSVSRFDNDVSNATALFEVAGDGSFRTNEFRRVGYPSHIRESRFRFFGTEASMEQLATVAFWQDKSGVKDISELLEPKPALSPDDPSLEHIAPELRAAFTSGSAPVHDRSRLPRLRDR